MTKRSKQFGMLTLANADRSHPNRSFATACVVGDCIRSLSRAQMLYNISSGSGVGKLPITLIISILRRGIIDVLIFSLFALIALPLTNGWLSTLRSLARS